MTRTKPTALVLALEADRCPRISEALSDRGIGVIDEITTLEGAQDIVERARPELLVVDLSAEPADGEAVRRDEEVLDFVLAMRELVPGLRAVMVSSAQSAALIPKALSRGIEACVFDPEAG